MNDISDIFFSLIKKNKFTLCIAESCTGGLFSKIITDEPGASEFFSGAVIAYSNEIKKNILSVPLNILNKYGAVSSQTAKKMLIGLEKFFKTDIKISITGIAGPAGGTKTKPVGLVYIGYKFKNKIKISKYIFSGNRKEIRYKTVSESMNLIVSEIKNYETALNKRC